MEREKAARVRIGGLWMNDAGTVMSGNVGGMRLVIFLNQKRDESKPNSPTHTAYWEELPPKDDKAKGSW